MLRFRNRSKGLLSLSLLLCFAISPLRGEEKEAQVKIGAKINNSYSLRDLRGNRRPLHSFKENKAIVIAFLGTECPLSSVSVPRLVKLEKKYRKQDVLFLAVYPNVGDDLDDIAIHSSDRDVPFPVLKDFEQKLCDQLSVKRVPTVVVLDDKFTLRYRGRIDDQYSVGARAQKPSRNDLDEALKELLAGKKVTVAETEGDGCIIERDRKAPALKDVTYSKQVSRILQKRCTECHRPHLNAPFSLLTYEDAVQHAKMIKEVTTQKRMPPWHADPRHGKFSNDRSMTQEEIRILSSWVDNGTPMGDRKDLPKPKKYAEGWALGKPDVVFEMPQEYEVPAEGVLPYKYFTIETNFKEDRWVKLAEAKPGAYEVVHHIVAFILPPGQSRPFKRDGTLSVLVGWAPGDLPFQAPEGTALRVPKGSKLLIEMHYTPNGKKQKDRSRVGITFAKKPPEREVFVNGFMNESIKIPARAPHHEELATIRFYHDARLISLLPHMHWRGKDYRYELTYPDGKTKTLLNVPRWDFNWQTVYFFEKPIKIPKGSKLRSVAHWDNTRNNPYNPDPTETVKFGLQTKDEMMVGWAVYVWEDPKTAEKLAKNPIPEADLAFDRFDRNGDDEVTMDELPGRLQTALLLTGLNLPKKADRETFKKFYTDIRKKLRR